MSNKTPDVRCWWWCKTFAVCFCDKQLERDVTSPTKPFGASGLDFKTVHN